MAQQYDTTGKDILNEQINEIAQFVLNVSDVQVLTDLDTEQQLVRAFRTDITKGVHFIVDSTIKWTLDNRRG